MSVVDARGCGLSGSTPIAREAYERALAAFLGWRSGADVQVALAVQEAPAFVMAHVLEAYLLLCSRDPSRVRAARAVLARAARLPANDRERVHLSAIAAALADDYELATARLGALLRQQPHDVLALQAAHALDYLVGNAHRMRNRVAVVLPAWSRDLPGYHAVLAMHAFGLAECGEYEHAEQAAGAALALNELNAQAMHAMVHVFEMTDRAAAGLLWMNERVGRWGTGTVVATHCRWHLALFHLQQGRPDAALALYDTHIRAGHSAEVADLIDASALLWRIRLGGGDAGARWSELAAAWAPHVDDAFCSFSDVHAMLAFVGAQDWDAAQRLERSLARGQSLPTRHGETTRLLGLPASRALIAFGRGQYTLAVSLLAGLPTLAHRIGGSHAQRDVLHLTLLEAVERVRRPPRRPDHAPLPTAANA